MNLLGLHGDIIGLIFSPQYIGSLGCTVAGMVCKDLAGVVRGKTLKKSTICEAAAAAGHFDVLKWLHEYGGPLTADTCTAAAGAGHLDIVKWLRENGCPWNSTAQKFAARGGHLEVIKWLDANGCPRDAFSGDYAAYGGHVHILEWMNRCGYNMYWTGWLYSAVENNQVEILKYVWGTACGRLYRDVDKLTLCAAENGCLEVIKWLHSMCIFNSVDRQSIIEKSRPNIIEWMIDNGLYSN